METEATLPPLYLYRNRYVDDAVSPLRVMLPVKEPQLFGLLKLVEVMEGLGLIVTETVAAPGDAQLATMLTTE